jgi:hypothetical protein
VRSSSLSSTSHLIIAARLRLQRFSWTWFLIRVFSSFPIWGLLYFIQQPSVWSGCALCGVAAKGRLIMASLLALQGRGGGRIPMPDGTSLRVSRHDLVAILDAMPVASSQALYRATQHGDIGTAQQLLRDAAVTYFACAPAAPAAAPMTPRHAVRRAPTRIN